MLGDMDEDEKRRLLKGLDGKLGDLNKEMENQ
jgi:hypothetical protein